MSMHFFRMNRFLGAVLFPVLFMPLVLPALKAAGADEKSASVLLTDFARQWDESTWTSANNRGDYMRPEGDPGWKMRFAVLQTLVREGKASIPALTKALSEKENDPTRILAAQALSYLAPHASAGPLRQALAGDPLPVVRLYAADALGMRGVDEETDSFLASRLEAERNRDVRSHIKYARSRGQNALKPEVARKLVEIDPAVVASAAVGKPAPDFALMAVGGDKPVRLKDYRGKKPVVLVFLYGDT